MKLSVAQSGGIGGFQKRTEIAEDALSPKDAEVLRERVEQAGVLEMADEGSHGRGADETEYRIVVEDAGRTHIVTLSESGLSEGVRALITWARSLPESKTRVEPPGHGAS